MPNKKTDNPTDEEQNNAQHMPPVLADLKKALDVLRKLIKDGAIAERIQSGADYADTYSQIREALISAGISSYAFDVAAGFPISQKGTDEEGRYYAIIEDDGATPEEALIAVWTSFFYDMLKAPPPAIKPVRPKKVEYPLDLVNGRAWGLVGIEPKMPVSIQSCEADGDKEASITFLINFDAIEKDKSIELSKSIGLYDKKVYIAAATLHNAGNDAFSATQVYHTMGCTGTPGSDDLKKINDAVTKMGKTWIYVDTSKEEEAGCKYERFYYDGSLLPFERVTRVVNGKVTDTAIHLLREPPLLEFAKGRKQVATIDIKVLQSPISKTDNNIILEDYLIRRISRAKSGHQPKRILYKTVCEKTGANAPMQISRMPGRVNRFLDYYKECGFISGYRQDKDGVTISFPKAKAGE